MTRLVYIHNIAMPGPEANTVNVAKMCAAFASHGADVTLAAVPGAVGDLRAHVCAHYDVPETFEMTPLPPQAARPTVAALSGAAIARQKRADIVYTRAPHVALATCLSGVATILEVHTPSSAFSRLGQAAFRRVARHPRLLALVAISEALAKHLREQHPNAHIVVAHDGADMSPAVAPPMNDVFRAGFVGRFYRGKGVELIAQIAALCPDVEFHLVGGDAEGAAHLVGEPLPDNMVFHGSVTHAAATELIDTFDIALAPYQRAVMVADGKTDTAAWMSPLKLFEYMAARKAILASDLPVLHEILSDGETALLLPPDDARAWASALHQLLHDTKTRDALSARAHEQFVARYTWSARGQLILDRALSPSMLR